jgi:Protein of unknown function (DUF1416)
MCGALPQTAAIPAGVDLSKQTVITGVVTRNGAPVPGAYVRLLDATGEFAAEVPTSATGDFRFFAAPGAWTLTAVHRSGSGRQQIEATGPGLLRAGLVLN